MDEKNKIIEEKKEILDYWSNIRRMSKEMIIEEMRKKIMEGSK
jgi:hypothetical protein